MAILNYTTTIDASKTLGEIQKTLAMKGATAMQIDYEGGQPTALTFAVAINGRSIAFRLPSKHAGVLRAMKRDRKIPARLQTEAQALRVAWRITKDWVEAQLAIIEADMASLAEVFLPYAVASDGRTVYEQFEQHGFPMLPEPR